VHLLAEVRSGPAQWRYRTFPRSSRSVIAAAGLSVHQDQRL